MPWLEQVRKLVSGERSPGSPPLRRTRLGLTPLEAREVPAADVVTPGPVPDPGPGGGGVIGSFETNPVTPGADDPSDDGRVYVVRLLSPSQGVHGDAGAAIVGGGLSVWDELPPDGQGGVYVSASTAEEAVFKAVVGSVIVNLSTVIDGASDPTYDFINAQVGQSTGDRKPFQVTPNRIWLEDLAALPERSDWDDNDDYWDVSVNLVTTEIPRAWKSLSKPTFETLMDKQGVVLKGSPNYDRTIGNVFQQYVGRSMPQELANGQAFPTGGPPADQVTVTPDFVDDSRTRLRDAATGQFLARHTLPKGFWADAKIYKRNIGSADLGNLFQGLDTLRVNNSTDARYTLPRLLVITNSDVSVTAPALAAAADKRVLVEQARVQWRQVANGPQLRVPASTLLNWDQVRPNLPSLYHVGNNTMLAWDQPPPFLRQPMHAVLLT